MAAPSRHVNSLLTKSTQKQTMKAKSPETREIKRPLNSGMQTPIPVADFVRAAILDHLEKSESLPPTSIPCPFCNKTDSLQTIQWCHERPDQTEYNCDAVKCVRCDAVAAVPTWMKRRTSAATLVS
jgi:hypothetical protein